MYQGLPGQKKTPTEAQRGQQERFKLPNEYAGQAKDEPVYTALAEKTSRSASNIACSDWFHRPAIHDISRRSGCIRIVANDNVHVLRVHVTITDKQGNAIGQGEARQFYDAWWEFETRIDGDIRV